MSMNPLNWDSVLHLKFPGHHFTNAAPDAQLTKFGFGFLRGK
jgi:hypothetical protein